MFSFYWNENRFSVLQYGKGVLLNDMPGHSHSSSSYELHYIINGNGSLKTDNDIYELSKGDFFITGPNIYHKQITNIQNPLQEIHIYLQLDTNKENDEISKVLFSKAFIFFHNEDLCELFMKIYEEKDNKIIGYELIVSAYIQIILSMVVRHLKSSQMITPVVNDDLNDKRFLLIEQALISKSNDLSLLELSNIIGLSERQTQRFLKQYYSKTFSELQEELNK